MPANCQTEYARFYMESFGNYYGLHTITSQSKEPSHIAYPGVFGAGPPRNHARNRIKETSDGSSASQLRKA